MSAESPKEPYASDRPPDEEVLDHGTGNQAESEADVVLDPGGAPAEEPGADPPRDPDVLDLWRVVRLILEVVASSASAVDDALNRVQPARQVALDVIVGGGAVASDATSRVAGRLVAAARSIAGGALRLPLVEGWLARSRALSLLAERGRRERSAAAVDLRRLADALVPTVTAAVLDRLDLTALVRDRVALDPIVAGVDIDAVTARVDIDAIAQRIDLNAIVDRLDLVSLTNRVLDGIDLPEIIRESTGSISGDVVRGTRMQGIEADQAVAGLVGRLLHRRPVADTAVAGQTAVAAQEGPS